MGLCCVSCYDDSALVERIDALEQSTIASLKASISSLESQSGDIKSSIASLEQSGNANATEIAALKTSLGAIEAKIEELKSWVEKLLEGYYTKEEIDAQIQSLNTEIETLRTKISSIESKLDILMREFVISFDDTEIGILAGGTTSVGYIITGATEKTTVKALGQNGWSAKVTPDGTDKGKITVTAPDPLTEDEIIVLVYDGEFRTIMSSINFVTGVVTPSQTAVELDAEAGTVDITVTSNLNYKVSIPEEAKDWLSVVETKSTKTETITFAYTECTGGIRKAIVTFVDDINNAISKITFVQQGSAVEVTLTEAGTLLKTLGNDIYQNLKGLTIHGPLNGSDFFIIRKMSRLTYLNLSDAKIVAGGEGYYTYTPLSTTYYTKNDEIGDYMFYMLTIDNIILPKDITKIGQCAFANSSIKSIDIPSSCTIISGEAFKSCDNITSLIIPDSVISLGYEVCSYCNNLKVLELSKSLTSLESLAFRDCPSVEKVEIPESITTIGYDAFMNWRSLKEVTIPKNVNHLGVRVFEGCVNLEKVFLKTTPTTLTSIGSDLFPNSVYENATLYVPSGSTSSWFYTDFGRFVTVVEE